MVHAVRFSNSNSDVLYPNFSKDLGTSVELAFQVPDPEDEQISEPEFQSQVDTAWQVCDRFDLQTDIWRGRILRAWHRLFELAQRSGNQQNSGIFLN
jgi:hypothetical protein